MAGGTLNLKQTNNSLKEDVIDLKCRPMRDNLLFFGITEVVDNDQQSIGTTVNASGGTQTASGEPLDASGDMPHAAMGSATYDRS
ncbi:hypothetical protein DPMN_111761 [Dreissena polymorpha]|uniref:Uncharacterized protein n=1 Tax=Dreissena polymorpha TaxID=45954 RepID=A0A9D4KF37_DREPO|nr:hypothetical protein DPMN_111761 [Dreissena polymorpha]